MKNFIVAALLSLLAAVPVLARIRPEVPPFDTLYRDGIPFGLCRCGPYMLGDTLFYYESFRKFKDITDSCRIYVEKDSSSEEFRKMIRRAGIDKHIIDDVGDRVRRMKERGIGLRHLDVGELEDIYIPLYLLGDMVVVSSYRSYPAYISDSLVVWHEFDSWAYAIRNVVKTGPDTTEIEALSDTGQDVSFRIKVADPERGVIHIQPSSDSYVPQGYYVRLSKAHCFPLMVWDSNGEPDDVVLPSFRRL